MHVSTPLTRLEQRVSTLVPILYMYNVHTHQLLKATYHVYVDIHVQDLTPLQLISLAPSQNGRRSCNIKNSMLVVPSTFYASLKSESELLQQQESLCLLCRSYHGRLLPYTNINTMYSLIHVDLLFLYRIDSIYSFVCDWLLLCSTQNMLSMY